MSLKNESTNELEDTVNSTKVSNESINLDFSDGHLINFPLNEIFPFTSCLCVLDLSFNFLSNIPTEIGFLIRLERLNLDHNQIISLPEEIGLLTQLEVLTLNSNRLSHLPFSITCLTRLNVLNLLNNPFYKTMDQWKLCRGKQSSIVNSLKDIVCNFISQRFQTFHWDEKCLSSQELASSPVPLLALPSQNFLSSSCVLPMDLNLYLQKNSKLCHRCGTRYFGKSYRLIVYKSLAHLVVPVDMPVCLRCGQFQSLAQEESK